MMISVRKIIDEEIKKIFSENINRKIERLYFFDFDGTLIKTFGPEEGKKKYKETTGEDYPYQGEFGWWNSEESLKPFDFSANQAMMSEYKEAKNDKQGISILLTNRDGELHNIIMKILDKHGLKFDHYDYADQPNPIQKSNRIKTYLNQYPEVNSIKVYDDKDEQIRDFQNMKKDLNDVNIDVEIHKVKS